MVIDSNKRLWTTLNCNYDCTLITCLARRGRSSICRAVRKPAARQTQPGLLCAELFAAVLVVWSLLTRYPRVDAAARAHHYRHPHRPGRDLGGNGCRCRAGLHRTYLPPEPSGSPHDRYTKAVEQLGSDKIEVRLGGIYALERLMRDSSTDQPTIVEVLAAYIRQHAPLSHPALAVSAAPAPSAITRPRVAGAHQAPRPVQPDQPDADVQAALTVLGRRTAVAGGKPINLILRISPAPSSAGWT